MLVLMLPALAWTRLVVVVVVLLLLLMLLVLLVLSVYMHECVGTSVNMT